MKDLLKSGTQVLVDIKSVAKNEMENELQL